MDFKQIKTYEDACADQGKDPKQLPDVSMLPTGLQKFLLASLKLAIIAVSLNKDAHGKERKANWTGDEYNYCPWFEVEGADEETPSGSGLSFVVCDFGNSDAYVASRLTYRSSAIAKYAGEQFKDLYEDLLLHKED